MSEDEQEALSHQHSHGFWLVILESGCYAVFTHPNGKLLTIVDRPSILWDERNAAAARHAAKLRPPLAGLDALNLNLEEIDL